MNTPETNKTWRILRTCAPTVSTCSPSSLTTSCSETDPEPGEHQPDHRDKLPKNSKRMSRNIRRKPVNDRRKDLLVSRCALPVILRNINGHGQIGNIERQTSRCLHRWKMSVTRPFANCVKSRELM